MILVEGYTDVLALHQAGLGNAVGIMGTALTEEQIAELERVANVLVLCLDADRAGQDAMLRAAQLTDQRKLELRVVALPEGTDPADLIERAGAEALRERVAASVPFVKFHVERILERGDLSSAEGRDRAFSQLRPALRDLPKNAFGEELLRRVAGQARAQLRGAARSLIEGARQRSGPAAAPRATGSAPRPELDQRLRAGAEHSSHCASRCHRRAPATLFEIDTDQLITSELLRRAARHIAGRTLSPLADLPAGRRAAGEDRG